MQHPIAELFDGYAEAVADLHCRPADTADHTELTRRIIDAHHPRRLALAVTEISTETATSRTFRLRRPGVGDLPPFLAGQYVTVFTDGTSRPFAISSSPARLGHYDLTVRRVPGGRISNLLIDTLAVGELPHPPRPPPAGCPRRPGRPPRGHLPLR